jgi:hypothetical protein
MLSVPGSPTTSPAPPLPRRALATATERLSQLVDVLRLRPAR